MLSLAIVHFVEISAAEITLLKTREKCDVKQNEMKQNGKWQWNWLSGNVKSIVSTWKCAILCSFSSFSFHFCGGGGGTGTIRHLSISFTGYVKNVRIFMLIAYLRL